ncbi:MAG: SRPBCC family protein [Armatimonadetes bacterium]|nr:SRPBCC family protein [Armatimonadota bacterium]
MLTLLSKTLSVSIDCPPGMAYDFLSNPENLPRWAAGLCLSIASSGDDWIVTTPQGPMTIRFSERNGFGVLDHTVSPAPGAEVYVPMRVVPNGTGCELTFTLFRMPGMSEAQFAEDAGIVHRDLNRVKTILEAMGSVETYGEA